LIDISRNLRRRQVNPEKYLEESKPQDEPPTGFHPKAYAELTAELQRLGRVINAELESIKRRYGI